MKNKFMLLTLILSVFLSFSCKKNEEAQAVPQGEILESELVEDSGISNPGYVLRVNAGMYSPLETDTGEETDRTRWLASMTLGERVLTGNVRRATYTGDGRVYSFIEIRRENGSEGYALTLQVAAGGRLAVIIEENANLFRSPKVIDVSGITIPRKTVVVYFPETENGGFVEIRGYDPERQDYIRADNSYVRLSSISRRDFDIQSSILLQTALELTDTPQNKIRRDTMLESAMLDYPDSIFFAEIRALVNPNAVSTIETEPENAPSMFVTGINVEVRDFPDLVAGRVIHRLSYDTEVIPVERTKEVFFIGGNSSRWYHITAPVEGWVFGAFLIY